MFTIGAFGIIEDVRNRILLCHRTDVDLWNLPGGGVEGGESPWAAVTREVLEETGLHIRPVQLPGVYSKPEVNEIVFSFRCNVLSGTIRLNDEADSIEYFALADIPENTSRKQVERMHHALERQDFPILHEQYGASSTTGVDRKP